MEPSIVTQLNEANKSLGKQTLTFPIHMVYFMKITRKWGNKGENIQVDM